MPISILKGKSMCSKIKVEPMDKISEERMALVVKLIREHTRCILKKEALKIDRQFMEDKG